jgi:exodeoxyribonuclease VII large subunit
MLDHALFSAPVWQVGALCSAIAQALEEGFNPVTVVGEISGFSRAASGHCYFSLKDANGQLRCAMFRRAASSLTQVPRDGDRVEVRGRLGVYEPRGDLQLIVESLERAGQGNLFEEFLRRKERLEREGLFDVARKRPLRAMPRGIGIVTSLGAAALHDVVSALQRRVPHIPVVLVSASVQGEQAAAELVRALQTLYACVVDPVFSTPIDAILLVRGGGAMEDLWSFNDEVLARTIAQSPVPVISGVGHETDFTIADFVADVRAPTPTAAAELVSETLQSGLLALTDTGDRLQRALQRYLDREAQQLDRAAARIGRLSGATARQHAHLQATAQNLGHALRLRLQTQRHVLAQQQPALQRAVQQGLALRQAQCAQAQLRLQALDPALVLARGYAWLSNSAGRPVTSVYQVEPGQSLTAVLADGSVELAARSRHPN